MRPAHFLIYVILNEVKNPTEELMGVYSPHFGRGIFRYAQYDVLFLVVIARHEVPRQSVEIKSGIYALELFQGDRHACARDDTEIQLSLRGSVATAAISREGEFLQGIYFSLGSWDISLTLKMT